MEAVESEVKVRPACVYVWGSAGQVAELEVTEAGYCRISLPEWRRRGCGSRHVCVCVCVCVGGASAGLTSAPLLCSGGRESNPRQLPA